MTPFQHDRLHIYGHMYLLRSIYFQLVVLDIKGAFVIQVEIVNNCCILAAVGQRMASTHGVSATLFTALAKVRVNTLQGKYHIFCDQSLVCFKITCGGLCSFHEACQCWVS
jgi:hypothetical protein